MNKQIEANSLRIGNLIYPFTFGEPNPICEIVAISKKDIVINYCGSEHIRKIDDVFPIPLSPEILLEYGFIKVKGIQQWVILEYDFSVICQFDSIFYVWIKGKVFEIKYLHDLQNIFLDLTRAELTKTPSVEKK